MISIGDQASAVRDAVGVATQPEWVAFHLGGDDVTDWLQGQVTQDLRALEPGTALRSLVVDLRGRVAADLWIVDRGDGLVVLAPGSAAPTLEERFDKYIVMEDVDVTPLPHRLVGVYGPRADEAVAGFPEAFVCDRLGVGGRELLVPEEELDATLAALEAAAEALAGCRVEPEALELARLRLGVPSFGRDFGDQTYPQEAGLEKTAVSFGKGCYVGQEPVVMLEHRGKPPKRLLWLELDAGDAPAHDAPVRRDGEDVGRVTSSMRDPEGPVWAMALVRRAVAEEPGDLTVGGRPARVRALVGAGELRP